MKSFLGACVAVAVITAGAWFGLNEVWDYDSADAKSDPRTVRLD